MHNLVGLLHVLIIILFKVPNLSIFDRLKLVFLIKFHIIVSTFNLNNIISKYKGFRYESDYKGLLALGIMLKDYQTAYNVPLRKKPVVVDIGAHVGNYSLAVKTYFPDSKIFAFEPVAHNFSILKSNLINYPDIELFNVALGSKSGKLTMYSGKGQYDRASVYKENLQSKENLVQEVVTLETLDKIFSNFKLQKVDVIKIDTEGYEYEVLKGAKNTLKKTNYLIIEVHLQKHYPLFLKSLSLLNDAGLKLYNVGKVWRTDKNKINVMELVFIKDMEH